MLRRLRPHRVSFQTGSDVVSFFQAKAGQHYIDWFNQKCAGKQSWAGKQLGGSDAVKSIVPADLEQHSVYLWDTIHQPCCSLWH